MWSFRNSDQAQGYALAQSEINTANALVAAQRFRANLAAGHAARVNHALAHTVDKLRAALIAETERADSFQAEADKLCATLIDMLADYERLMNENKELRTEIRQLGEDCYILARQIPSPDVEF